ncbi:response regulator [Psychroserpens sp. XS_ASV72]|uniref:response regulator n=1 Tax=Psychroserpens sp. XS_ASV72 TaxID=3241293 RepID=UPI0035161CC5
MESTPRKILICEDHQIVVDGLVSIFKNQPDYQVIGYIKNGGEVLTFLKRQLPDVILLDINLPEVNGLEILKSIRQLEYDIKVIVLTMYNKENIIRKVKQFNGNGFLLKNSSTEDVLKALDTVFDSKSFYMGKGVKNLVDETDGFVQKVNITNREKEIIKELVKGYNVPQIAERLYISNYTVETHKKNIFRKLNIHNSIDLVTLVNEKNLLS